MVRDFESLTRVTTRLPRVLKFVRNYKLSGNNNFREKLLVLQTVFWGVVCFRINNSELHIRIIDFPHSGWEEKK